LEKSCTLYVTLRPNWFSDNFHTFWKSGIEHGQAFIGMFTGAGVPSDYASFLALIFYPVREGWRLPSRITCRF
jgi:uncharacterized protein YbjT (DUF2867 family)